MSEKPTAAFVLSLIGGLFILIGGLLITTVGAFLVLFPVAGVVVTPIVSLG